MLDKIAIIGANPAMRMIAKIVFSITGSSMYARFLKTEKKALDWLKTRSAVTVKKE